MISCIYCGAPATEVIVDTSIGPFHIQKKCVCDFGRKRPYTVNHDMITQERFVENSLEIVGIVETSCRPADFGNDITLSSVLVFELPEPGCVKLNIDPTVLKSWRKSFRPGNRVWVKGIPVFNNDHGMELSVTDCRLIWPAKEKRHEVPEPLNVGVNRIILIGVLWGTTEIDDDVWYQLDLRDQNNSRARFLLDRVLKGKSIPFRRQVELTGYISGEQPAIKINKVN